MSIYNDKKIGFKFDFSLKELKYPIMALIAIALILLIAFTVSVLLQPKALVLKLDPNPMDLTSTAKAGITTLTVQAANTTGKNASNVLIEVEPLSKENLIAYPEKQVIPTLGTRENKTARFIIRPNPAQKLFAGNYEINVSMKINSMVYTEKAILTVKTE